MKNRPPIYFLLSLLVFLADQASKNFIRGHVAPFETIVVMPFFNIIHAENIGSAFGMFKSLGNTFFVIIALAAMIVVSVLIVKDSRNRLIFSLVLGGAAGNLMDRIRFGYVVDFLDVYVGRHHWPAFNVADSALTLGIILLLFRTLMEHKSTVGR